MQSPGSVGNQSLHQLDHTLELDLPEDQGKHNAEQLVDVFMGVPHNQKEQVGGDEFELGDKVGKEDVCQVVLGFGSGVVTLDNQVLRELDSGAPAHFPDLRDDTLQDIAESRSPCDNSSAM